jgi:hypothetical protein
VCQNFLPAFIKTIFQLQFVCVFDLMQLHDRPNIIRRRAEVRGSPKQYSIHCQAPNALDNNISIRSSFQITFRTIHYILMSLCHRRSNNVISIRSLRNLIPFRLRSPGLLHRVISYATPTFRRDILPESSEVKCRGSGTVSVI